MIKFAKERVNLICNQLKGWSIVQKVHLDSMRVKEGCFITPTEADAAPGEWKNFDMGKDHWYGPDRHYWFRTEVTVPESFDGKELWLRIHTGLNDWDDGRNPQFLLFINGQVIQGLDINHREVFVKANAKAGETFRMDLQSYTGTLHDEFHLIVDLEEHDRKLRKAYYDIAVPMYGLNRMKEDDKIRLDLETALTDTINLLDLRMPYSKEFYASVEAAEAHVQEAIYEKMGGYDEVIATCIGHTHIDVAWWWTVAQTREKVVRSFATVLKFMDEYPEYRFMSSQPVLYYFLKQRYPELYAQIQQRVKEGRWETEGGMWLEADCNLTSGESLVRQFIYGKRFFREEFGQDNRILWLPDVFGYSGALPQIMKKSGVDYFMTTKLAWNQINKIPNDTFIWRGIDGSQVLTHLITTLNVGQDPKENFFTTYNGILHPDAIMGGWERYQNKEINNDILVCYGYGDGGGGPTRQMLETARRMEYGVQGIPKVRQASARTYFEELETRVKDNPHLETWEGEFYFEYHRGTYTSMARNKRGNRKSELLMMDLELLGVLADGRLPYPAEDLRCFWRDTILLNQFHDILPGSSIAEVYEVTKKEYEDLAAGAGKLLQERLNLLAGEGTGVTVFNTLGFVRSGVVNLGDVTASALRDETGKCYPVQRTADGAVAYLENLPSKGYKTFALWEASGESPFIRKDAYHLETPYYAITLDENGHMVSIFDKKHDRELVQAGKAANQLRLYEDKPIYFDNWDIDMYYVEKSWPVDELVSMRWSEDGPVRTTLELEYRCNQSTIWQKIHFYANTPRIDFETKADWKEHQHLLKAEFPVDIHSDEATFEIQFGNVTRKVHTNTSWDKARFESCGQKWMDFSEGHYGVSLLNDCKYGHSVRDGVIGLTLIKCGVEPNPNADVEMHTFTYALFPHAGTWKEAGTVEESYQLNLPAYAVRGGQPGTAFSYTAVEPRNVVLETVKQAENGDGVVLRMYECENARTKTVVRLPEGAQRAYLTNLLEEIQEELPIVDGKVTFMTKPFEIQTVLVK